LKFRPATTDVIAGQIHVSFASTPGSVPVVKAGKVRALAVTSAKRIAKLPEVPTIAEAALPGYEASVWYGVVTPTRTPQPVIARLNGEIAKILGNPAHRERMIAADFEPTTSTPEQFAAFIKSETAKWALPLSDDHARHAPAKVQELLAISRADCAIRVARSGHILPSIMRQCRMLGLPLGEGRGGKSSVPRIYGKAR
jgi:hypothetical protein